MSILGQLSDAVQKGRVEDTLGLIDIGLREGIAASVLLEEGLMAGIRLLGVRFARNEVWVPEVMSAASALNKGMERLRPQMVGDGSPYKGRIVIGTVRGDLHDIGKNLVKMMLEGSGFTVIDLGVNVAEDDFVAAIREHRPDILCLSALLSTTTGQLALVIDAVVAAGLRDQVKILVGGAPVNSNIAATIGADGYAQDAVAAVELATRVITLAGSATV